MFIHAWSWLTIYTMCDMVCLCKVVCVGDWKLILLRLVICLVLLFSFVFFFSSDPFSGFTFWFPCQKESPSRWKHWNKPAPSCPGSPFLDFRWCHCGGESSPVWGAWRGWLLLHMVLHRQQGAEPLGSFHCSELLSSGPRSASRPDGMLAPSWFGRVVSVPACRESE